MKSTAPRSRSDSLPRRGRLSITITKITDYIGNFVYQDDVLQYISTSEGRTVYSPTEGSYKEEFFVKDHLGNVRSVTEVQTLVTSAYLATYEIASAHLEGLVFDKVSEIAEDNPDSPDPGNLQSGLLNGSDPSKRVGTSLLLKVMAGDRVELNVNSYYQGYNPTTDAPVNASTMLSAIVSTLTSGTGGLGGSESHNPQLVGSMFNSTNYSQFNSIVAAGNTTSPSRPKASLNYILFNQQMQVVSVFCGAYQVNGNGSWGEIGTTEPMEIPQSGYLAVYLDNSSTHPVYFDQLMVRFTRGKQLEETHYYPHGLPMGNIGSSAMAFMPNRQKHQSNEYIKDAGLNWMDFNFRQYDPQIGRFLSIDPMAASTDMMSPYTAMNNQPESMTDPNGLLADIYLKPAPNIYRFFGNPLLAMLPSVGDYMERNFGFGRIVGMMLADMEYKRQLADERRRQEASGQSTYSPIIGIPSFVCNYAGAGSGGGGSDDPQNIKEGAVFGGVAGLISVGEGAEVGGVGWGMWQSMQVTGVTAASTVGVFAMTAAAVLLPTTAGAGSTQEEYGIGSYGALGQYYLGNSSYPGPWNTTYRPPFEDPINKEFNNFNPNKFPNWKGIVRWVGTGFLLYQIYDEYNSHINNMPSYSPVDNTRVYPEIRPILPWERH